MLLASLLLKLGAYGFLRFSLTFLSEASVTFTPVVSIIAVLGIVYGSLTTIRQADLKRIVAYSSVAHMNLVMLSLFSKTQEGLDGAIFTLVAHGFVSAALFFGVGVLYDHYHSRLLSYYGGLTITTPLLAFFFLVFTLANMGFPGTSNFVGEILMFFGIFNSSSGSFVFAITGVVLGAVYSV
jgi:NADH-quinone oxidoreductase subunit M